MQHEICCIRKLYYDVQQEFSVTHVALWVASYLAWKISHFQSITPLVVNPFLWDIELEPLAPEMCVSSVFNSSCECVGIELIVLLGAHKSSLLR